MNTQLEPDTDALQQKYESLIQKSARANLSAGERENLLIYSAWLERSQADVASDIEQAKRNQRNRHVAGNF